MYFFLLLSICWNFWTFVASQNPWKQPPSNDNKGFIFRCVDFSQTELLQKEASETFTSCSGGTSPPIPEKTIPVVYIHKLGVKRLKSKYFELSVNQSCVFNRSVYVIMIGDNQESEQMGCAKMVHFPTSQANALFGDNYVHLSTNHYEFEKISIQRWFVLEKFMEEYNYEKVFFVDSDVLLYVDVTRDYYCNFRQCTFVISNYGYGASASGHSSFWNLHSVKELNEYVRSMYDVSTNRDHMIAFFDKYKGRFKHTKNASIGGICDMSHIGALWVKYQQKGLGHLACNSVDHYGSPIGLYDHKRALSYLNITQTSSGMPFYNFSDQLYPIKSLHFQGSSKTLLDRFCIRNV